MKTQLKAIFSRLPACLLRALDPILFYLPSELADAIFGDAGSEAGVVANQLGGAAPKAASTKKHKRARCTKLTITELRALEMYDEQGTYTATARKLGISRQGASTLVKKAKTKIGSASRSVQAKQTLPKDRRAQEMVPGTE